MKSINRVTARNALAVRREPYWYRIEEGRSIGFRRLSMAMPGKWIARYYDGANYQQRPLGSFDGVADEKRFDAAKKAAELWFDHLNRGGSAALVTVMDACLAYAAKLRQERSERAAQTAEGIFRRLVDADPLAKIDLSKLTPAHISSWRERVFGRGGKSTFNRNTTALRAALNLAHDERKVPTDSAWRVGLRPLKLDPGEGRRSLYLDRDARRLLIDKASAEFRPLLISWSILPVRPGDIAKLRVSDLDLKNKMLRILQGKTASRSIPLPDHAFAHFKQCARAKLPTAWLVARADGRQWDRFAWHDEMRAAVLAAKLPRATVAYSLRHAVITDMLSAGTDVFTVAKLAGTSVAMIDRHYGQLQQGHAREALEKLALA